METWDLWHGNISHEVMEDLAINPRFPNGVVVGLLMLIGLLGNILVLHIYHFRMEHTVFTTYITVLAALDLATTLISMPLDVVIKTLRVEKTITMEILCKTAHFQVYTCSLASGILLLFIAANRYSKVCRPTRPAWSVRQARVCSLLIVLGAMGLCTVSLVINGLEKVKISLGDQYLPLGDLIQNINLPANKTLPGHRDFLSTNRTHMGDSKQEGVPQTHDFSPSNISGFITQTKVVEVYICRTSEKQKGSTLYYVLYGLLLGAYLTTCLALLVLHSRISCTLLKFRRKQFRRDSVWSDTQQQSLNHITASMFRIFAAITAVFLLSYLPHLACVAAQRALFRPGEAMPRATRVVLDLAYNCPYVNVVANPFIYGCMSKRFRSHCADLLCCCRD